MVIPDALAALEVALDLPSPTKARLIRDLAARAGAALDRDPAAIERALGAREALGSTGLGGRIAIPHARLESLQKPFCLLARLKRPLDFEAIDDQPVDLVFLLLLPEPVVGEHLKLLACIARRLRDRVFADRIRSATSVETVSKLFAMPEG